MGEYCSCLREVNKNSRINYTERIKTEFGTRNYFCGIVFWLNRYLSTNNDSIAIGIAHAVGLSCRKWVVGFAA